MQESRDAKIKTRLAPLVSRVEAVSALLDHIDSNDDVMTNKALENLKHTLDEMCEMADHLNGKSSKRKKFFMTSNKKQMIENAHLSLSQVESDFTVVNGIKMKQALTASLSMQRAMVAASNDNVDNRTVSSPRLSVIDPDALVFGDDIITYYGASVSIATYDDVAGLMDDVDALCHLRHPNLGIVLGAYHEGNTLNIVQPKYEISLDTSMETQSFAPYHKLLLIKEIASALSYLHSRNPPIVHGSLSISNIMLDAGHHAVIVGHGLKALGSKRVASPSSDMYTFGVVMWSLLTDEQPSGADGECLPVLTASNVESELRDLIDIVNRCLNEDPTKRPTALEVVQVEVGVGDNDGTRSRASMDEGIKLLFGIQCDQDVSRAIKKLKSRPFDPTARFFLLINDVVRDGGIRQGGLDVLDDLADDDHYGACCLLSLMYRYGLFGVQQNSESASQYLTKSKESGVIATQEELLYQWSVENDDNHLAEYVHGICHLFGIGCPCDVNLALSHLCKAANRGSVMAQFSAGICYKYGIGCTPDPTLSSGYFDQASQQGHTGAMMFQSMGDDSVRDVPDDKTKMKAEIDRLQSEISALNNSIKSTTPLVVAYEYKTIEIVENQRRLVLMSYDHKYLMIGDPPAYQNDKGDRSMAPSAYVLSRGFEWVPSECWIQDDWVYAVNFPLAHWGKEGRMSFVRRRKHHRRARRVIVN